MADVKERVRTDEMVKPAVSKGEVAKKREPTPVEVLREQMERQKPEFDLVLPPGVTVDRFVRTIMTAVQADPDLLDADRKSLLQAAMQAAQDGLLPDKREGAFVIYNTKVKIDGKEMWIKMVQWMPMIRGIIKKSREGGEIATLSARVVYEHDTFEYVLGDEERIVHEPTMKQRGKLIACYAIAQMKDGEREREVMTEEDINAVRSVSRSKTGPWSGPFESEMWRKSVIRRLLKRLPMTPILEQILNRDESHYEFKDHNNVTWKKIDRPVTDAPPAPTRQSIAQKTSDKDEIEDAVLAEDRPEDAHETLNEASDEQLPDAGNIEREPGDDTQDDSGEITDDEIEAAVAFTREALAELGKFKTANAINRWYDETFLVKAEKMKLSEAQIAAVDNRRKDVLKRFG